MHGGRKGNLKLDALRANRVCKEQKRDSSNRRYGLQEFHGRAKNGDCCRRFVLVTSSQIRPHTQESAAPIGFPWSGWVLL
jgi:hypothetical protein